MSVGGRVHLAHSREILLHGKGLENAAFRSSSFCRYESGGRWWYATLASRTCARKLIRDCCLLDGIKLSSSRRRPATLSSTKMKTKTRRRISNGSSLNIPARVTLLPEAKQGPSAPSL